MRETDVCPWLMIEEEEEMEEMEERENEEDECFTPGQSGSVLQ